MKPWFDPVTTSDRPVNIWMPGAGSPTVYNSYDHLARMNNASISGQWGLSLAYSYDEGSEVTQRVATVGGHYSYDINYSYDNIGQLKAVQGVDDNGAQRLQEQVGYAYDKGGNLDGRTNNALIQNFAVNDLNELSSASHAGTLTVAGAAGEPSGNPPYGNSPGVTSVKVNGQSASVYEDGAFAATGFAPSPGQNNYTAIAQDNRSQLSTNSVTVNVSSGSDYTYDLNGNLTSDGTRNFAYDDENQLVGVWKANSWSNSFAYDGLMRKRIEQDFAWNGSGWAETNEVHYVYDGNLVLQERDRNNEPLTTYTRGVDLSGTLDEAGGIGGMRISEFEIWK